MTKNKNDNFNQSTKKNYKVEKIPASYITEG